MHRLCLALLLVLSACEQPAPQHFNGYVEAEALQLAPGRSGRLDLLPYARGSQVDAGSVLFAVDAAVEQAAVAEARARVDDLRKGKRSAEIDVLRAQLSQARAQAALADAQLRRQRELYARQAISGDQLDQARTAAARDSARVRELEASIASAGLAGREDALLAAEARVRQAEASLAEKSVAAPQAGRIEDIYYRVGEWVAAGSPVVSLLPPENRRLRFFVPEPVLGQLRPGQRVRVHCDGCDAAIEARLSFIASQAEYTPPVIYSRQQRAQLVYRVEASPDPTDALRLHPGQPVDVELVP